MTLNLFSGEEHQPFFWSGEYPAVLMVHGFPGTPAEMRPLANVFFLAGWTVQALLLPGFGSEIETLFERHQTEWVTAVEEAIIKLKQKYDPVCIVGYSMGAALAIQVAAKVSLDGLIVLAPFWKLANRRQQLLGLLLKPFVRRIQPFKRANFDDPKLRHSLSKMLAGLDPDDAEVQAWLRDLTVPVSMFERLHRVGERAYNTAQNITVPTLMIQGIRDEVVRPASTRQLLQQFPGPLHYLEVDAEHNLLDPDQSTWPQIERVVVGFVQSLVRERLR